MGWQCNCCMIAELDLGAMCWQQLPQQVFLWVQVGFCLCPQWMDRLFGGKFFIGLYYVGRGRLSANDRQRSGAERSQSISHSSSLDRSPRDKHTVCQNLE